MAKPAASTPTTVYSSLLSRIARPTMAGSPPNRPHPERFRRGRRRDPPRAARRRAAAGGRSAPAPQHVEEIPGGPNALHPFGRRLVAQVRAVGEEPGKARERSRGIAIVDEVRHVERRAIAARLIGPDPEHLFDVAIGQLSEQDAVHDAEDRRRRADRQCDRDDGPHVNAGVLRRARRL